MEISDWQVVNHGARSAKDMRPAKKSKKVKFSNKFEVLSQDDVEEDRGNEDEENVITEPDKEGNLEHKVRTKKGKILQEVEKFQALPAKPLN